MTEVAFHFNAPDKLAYACRLLRKALAGDAKVVVTAAAGTLDALDRALWTFSPVDFLPHCRAADAAPLLAASPIVLAEGGQPVPHHQVLLNLGEEVPPEFGRFERLIEVVGRDDEDDRQRARRRWKHYAERAYAITRHDLALKS
ncbi:DNA polymerase III subunit chi [Xylophilus sp. ASV27]|uniref:DNA polymerase III subunit chi n=1 Tax=Xylophilus sp. ASV27 TaxID=2795129 RepID=UPI0018EC0F0A|nr:DNA polymerase III subunit chi [Xylophilus sp. ASV27]